MIFNYLNQKVYYEIDGDLQSNRKVIVIINGIMMNVRSWDSFKEAFSKENVLIRFDMFDQGLSSKLNENYRQEIQVDLLKNLLVHLNIDQVNLVGISYGASIALQFSVKYPDLIEKMVIANGVAKTSDWLKDIGHGWNKVGKTRDGEMYYHITIPYIYSPEFYQKNIKWMNNRKKILLNIFSNSEFLDAMERLVISADTHDVLHELESVQTETLIISSEEDYLTPVFEQKILNEKLSNSHLVIIPNCGHASMYEKPELFTSLSLGFINSEQEKVI